nr:pyroglutamyl-peptidase 1 [Helicoverpa armigera]
MMNALPPVCLLKNECDGEPKRVLITGFGPFKGVPYNLSWGGVASMDVRRNEVENNIIILRKKIGVRYCEVDCKIPKLWRRFQPELAIHVGVHPTATTFLLETNARKRGYFNPDIKQRTPRTHEAMSGDSPQITTAFNVKTICELFNEYPPAPKLKAKVSNDAGQYLCEYIYYTSLCRGPALFVHIPQHKYTAEEVALGLQRILELCLINQLSDEILV